MSDISNVTRELCEANRNTFDERFRRDEKLLDEHKKMLLELKEVSDKLSEMIKFHTDALTDSKQRLTSLEQRPGNMWDRVVGGVIAAVSGGIAAVVISLLLK